MDLARQAYGSLLASKVQVKQQHYEFPIVFPAHTIAKKGCLGLRTTRSPGLRAKEHWRRTQNSMPMWNFLANARLKVSLTTR